MICIDWENENSFFLMYFLVLSHFCKIYFSFFGFERQTKSVGPIFAFHSGARAHDFIVPVTIGSVEKYSILY